MLRNLIRSSKTSSQWSSTLDRAQQLIEGRDQPVNSWGKLFSGKRSGNDLMTRLFFTPSLSFSSASTAASTAVNAQPGLLSADPSLPMSPLAEGPVDMNKLLGARNLSFLSPHIRQLAESNHPVLHRVAQYYLHGEGKKVRPLLVLLMAQATSLLKDTDLCAVNGGVPSVDGSGELFPNGFVLPSQITLAMITELIHTASLLHDDVIDQASTRRNIPAAHQQFGNKMAILAGDYLLSRASVALARLGNVEVVELLAEVVGDLVEGEVMQAQGNGCLENQPNDFNEVDRAVDESFFVPDDVLFQRDLVAGANLEIPPEQSWHRGYFETYLRKTYLKTASLMAKSCRAAAVLHSHQLPESVLHACFLYGQHLGIAFQLVDDALDFTESSEQIGKPSGGNDLQLGLATAPVLYASIFYPVQLRPLIDRQFTRSRTSILTKSMNDTSQSDKQHVSDDVQIALNLVQSSHGVQMTKNLARWHSQQAVDAIMLHLPPSPAREMLIELAERVCSRRK